MKKYPNIWLDLDMPRTTAFTFNDCQLTYLTTGSPISAALAVIIIYIIYYDDSKCSRLSGYL